MTEPQVYAMQANDEEDMKILNDPEQRKRFVAVALKQTQQAGFQILQILDPEGKQVYVESTSSRLWDLVHEAHEKLEATLAKVRTETKTIHALIQEATHAFDAGQIEASHKLLTRAIDMECDLFGDCPCSGDEKLLAALGYEEE